MATKKDSLHPETEIKLLSMCINGFRLSLFPGPFITGRKLFSNFFCKRLGREVKNAYLYKKERDMKKEPKVEYGIQIVKPWSTEMYNHNELVADLVRNEVESMLIAEMTVLQEMFESEDEGSETEVLDASWDIATPNLIRLQKAVTCFGYGIGYNVAEVMEQVYEELDNSPLYRLNEMADELDIKLEKGFVGFN